MPFWALILHATAGWTPHTWKINQINASRGRARTRMTTYEHLCISSCLGSDRLSASTHRRTPVILVSRAGSHFPPSLSLRPSLSFKSSFVVPLPLLFLRSFVFPLLTRRFNFLIHPSPDRTPYPSPPLPVAQPRSSRLAAPAFVISKWRIETCCFARTIILQNIAL